MSHSRVPKGSFQSLTPFILVLLALCVTGPVLVSAVECNGMSKGRRYCTGAYKADDSCPEPCKLKACSRIKPSPSKVPGAARSGGAPTWQELAETGLYEHVYTYKSYMCMSVCYFEPWRAKCEKSVTYAGSKYCMHLNCEHDRSNRFVGCHVDKNGNMKLPWHQPTCQECLRVFPRACKSELGDFVDKRRNVTAQEEYNPDEDNMAQNNEVTNEDDVEDGSSWVYSFFPDTPLALGEERVDIVQIIFQLNGTANSTRDDAAIQQAVADLTGVAVGGAIELQGVDTSDDIVSMSFVVTSGDLDGILLQLDNIPEADKVEVLRNVAGAAYLPYSMSAVIRQVSTSTTSLASYSPVIMAEEITAQTASPGLPVFVYALVGVGAAVLLAVAVAATVLVNRKISRARQAQRHQGKTISEPGDDMETQEKELDMA